MGASVTHGLKVKILFHSILEGSTPMSTLSVPEPIPPAPALPAAASIPRLRLPVALDSLHAVQVYRRTWAATDYNLYLSAILVRVRGERTQRYAGEIRAVEAAIDGLFEGPAQYFHDQARHLAAAHPTPTPDLIIAYRHPVRESAEARTPRMRTFLDLLQQLDARCRGLDAAWFAGVLDTETQLRLTREAARQVSRLAARIDVLARGVARRVLRDDPTPAAMGYEALLGRTQPPLPMVVAEPEAEVESEEPMATAEAWALIQQAQTLTTEPLDLDGLADGAAEAASPLPGAARD